MDFSIFLASITESGSSECGARRSRWWAPSLIRMAIRVSDKLWVTPPPDQGSNNPLLSTKYKLCVTPPRDQESNNLLLSTKYKLWVTPPPDQGSNNPLLSTKYKLWVTPPPNLGSNQKYFFGNEHESSPPSRPVIHFNFDMDQQTLWRVILMQHRTVYYARILR